MSSIICIMESFPRHIIFANYWYSVSHTKNSPCLTVLMLPINRSITFIFCVVHSLVWECGHSRHAGTAPRVLTLWYMLPSFPYQFSSTLLTDSRQFGCHCIQMLTVLTCDYLITVQKMPMWLSGCASIGGREERVIISLGHPVPNWRAPSDEFDRRFSGTDWQTIGCRFHGGVAFTM